MVRAIFLSFVLVFISGRTASVRGEEVAALAPTVTAACIGAAFYLAVSTCEGIDRYRAAEREKERSRREEQREIERRQEEKERRQEEKERRQEEKERRQEEKERHRMEMERLRQEQEQRRREEERLRREQKSAALLQNWSLAMSGLYGPERRPENLNFDIAWNSAERQKIASGFVRLKDDAPPASSQKRHDISHSSYRLQLSFVTDEPNSLHALGRGTMDAGFREQLQQEYQDPLRKAVIDANPWKGVHAIKAVSFTGDFPQSDGTWNTLGDYTFDVCNSGSAGIGRSPEDGFTDDFTAWTPSKQSYDGSSVDVRKLICNSEVSSFYRINLALEERTDETAEADCSAYNLKRRPRKNPENMKLRIDSILRETADDSVVWFLQSEQERRSSSKFQEPVSLKGIRHLTGRINFIAGEVIKAQNLHWSGSPFPPDEPDSLHALDEGTLDADQSVYEPAAHNGFQFGEIWNTIAHQTYQIHLTVQFRESAIQGDIWHTIGNSTYRFNVTVEQQGF